MFKYFSSFSVNLFKIFVMNKIKEAYFFYYIAERKLTRGISRATDNFTLVSQARKELAEDFDTVELHPRPASLKLELPEHSFSLPDFSVFPENLREYLQRDLIETATLVSLEQAGMDIVLLQFSVFLKIVLNHSLVYYFIW